MLGNSKNTHPGVDNKNYNERKYRLEQFTHHVAEEGHHMGDRALDTEVKIFERLIQFLDQNATAAKQAHTIRLFVRYDACPSCQTMMYKIKKAAETDPNSPFAKLKGKKIILIHGDGKIM